MPCVIVFPPSGFLHIICSCFISGWAAIALMLGEEWTCEFFTVSLVSHVHGHKTIITIISMKFNAHIPCRLHRYFCFVFLGIGQGAGVG